MKRTLLLFFALAFHVVMRGQQPSYTHITTDEGLPTHEVYSLLEDREGAIWIGCETGIYRYNGIKFQSFTNRDQRTRAITGLTELKDGSIACYNFSNQLFLLTNDSLQFLAEVAERSINIMHSPDSLYLMGVGSGELFSFDQDMKRSEMHFKFNKYGPFRFMERTHNGIAMLPKGEDTVHIFENDAHLACPIVYNTGTPSPGSYFLISNRGNAEWLFERLSGKIFRREGMQYLEVNDPALVLAVRNKQVNQITESQDGNLWILTFSGAVVYNPESGSINQYYTDFSVSDVLFDRNGIVWISTLNKGIIRLSNLQNKVWNESSSGIKSSTISNIVVSPKHLYFGSLNGEIHRLDRNNQSLRSYNTDNVSNISCMYYELSTGRLIFHQRSEIFSLKDDKIESVMTDVGPCKAIVEFQNHYVFATSMGTSVYTGLGQNKLLQQLNTGWTRDMAVDTTGKRLWLAADAGVVSYTIDAHGHWLEHTAISDAICSSLTIDSSKNDVLAVDFNGRIHKIKSSGEHIFITRLPPGLITHRIVVYEGDIYVATNNSIGIFRNQQWQWLDKSSGLVMNEVFDLVTNNGSIWLATNNGFQSMPIATSFYTPAARVILRSMAIDNTTAMPGSTLHLDPGSRIVLRPEAVCYYSEDRFQFAVRFSSESEEWSYYPAATEEIIVYPASFGDFILELKVVDHNGKDSENTIYLRGHLDPPLHYKPWFIAFFVFITLVFSLMIAGIISKTRAARDRKKLEQLHLVNELNEARQTALKAQMNPHFIFNVLNSIKGFIYENDKVAASQYLSVFADMIRDVLSMTEQAFVTLEDEVKFLDNYLRLEALQLPPDFTFRIHVSDELKAREPMLIPLLIQPFAENAVKHGLRNKEGPKHLRIAFSLIDDKRMAVIIEDNGIGRKASIEINESRGVNYQSFAVETAKKRIKAGTISDDDGSDGIKIIDSVDQDGMPTGTRVELIIHLP